MKREVPLVITGVIGLFMILSFFVPHHLVSVPADFLQACAVIVVACGYVLGGANVLRVNLEGISRREQGWPYKIVLVVSLLATLVIGIVDGMHHRGSFPVEGTPSKWIYDNLYSTMSATMFSLLAFFIASAAFRAFRIRTLEAGLLAVAAVIVMLGRVPLGELATKWLPEWLRFGALQEWIMDVPQNAAKRAILIGAALGVMATGLRVILGIERSYLGSEGSPVSLSTALTSLDRRWIFLVMGVLVLEPLLFPIPLPIRVTPPVRDFVQTIDALPPHATVLMSCDYDPSSIPEMVPMTRTAFRHLLSRDDKIVVTCLWAGGAALVDSVITEVSREFPNKSYGRDWVDLGYKSGNEAVMLLMGQGVLNVFPRDFRGNDARSLPIMHGVRDYSSFALLVNVSGGYPGTKEWVQQVQSRFHLPMVAGVTAVSAPEFYPYLQSHQLRGMLGGMAGAAEYETARHETGSATRGMAGQSLGHVFVALCIVLGNAVQFWQRRRA